MSRTRRKSSLTEEKTLVQYINRQLGRKTHKYHFEYYLTEAGKRAYEDAIREWEIQYYRWLNNHRYWKWSTDRNCFSRPPEEPRLFHFKKARVIFDPVDVEEIVNEATTNYAKYKRDGYFDDTCRNRSFKKHCARDLRRFNRELARKIIKDDDSWEQKPYPDTYLGKQHVWDYW